MNEDPALLRRFIEENSEAAFRELVERRIDFVYAAALRQVGGDTHLAQEVVQSVFIDLARKARSLAPRPNLTGWLYTSVRFAAAKARRSQARRLNHESEAHAMEKILSTPSATEANWNELRPVLDEAMHELREADREAILLRFFEGRSLAEIGAAVGVAENAARMRVDRALEKLRLRLADRGITSTAAALCAALAMQPAVAAPAGLAGNVAGLSLAGVTSGSGLVAARQLFTFMSAGKILAGSGVLFLIVAGGLYLGELRQPTERGSSAAGPQRQPAEVNAVLLADSRRLKMTADRIETAKPAAVDITQAEKEELSTLLAQAAEIRAKYRAAIRDNLRQIAAARDQFRLENGRLPVFAELVGPDKFIKRLIAINGENYAGLNLAERVLSVALDGVAVTYDDSAPSLPSHKEPERHMPAEIGAAFGKAAKAYREAHNGELPVGLKSLLPYFENPKDGADYVDWVEKEMGHDLLSEPERK